MIFYTDGSAHPNPGPGGFGVVKLNDDNQLIKCYSQQYKKVKVTNNRMELEAILYVMLKYGTKQNGEWDEIPIVYSDSSYCVNTLNDWMFRWASNHWMKSDKKIPENLDLIQTYYDHWQEGFRIDLRKIKGHAGEEWNELADDLATGRISAEEAERTYG